MQKTDENHYILKIGDNMNLKSDLIKINSITKYPSILTYHMLGERGRLLDEVQIKFNSQVIATEKIDGVNARIILCPDGFYIIGSREELLYAKGDLIGNPQLGIIDELKPVAVTLVPSNDVIVYYFEVYGGNVTRNSKNYTSERKTSHRLFDVAKIPDFENLFDLTLEQIHIWKSNGGQHFLSEEELETMQFDLTPRLGTFDIPTGLKDTYDWLHRILPNGTNAGLDISGRAEGIVIRTSDRSHIAKIRFEDYERTVQGKPK